MTAPPRPSLAGLDDEVVRYLLWCERRIEQLEATQREATWRPDRESDLD